MSPVLVMLTSRSDSNFKRSNVSLKENKPNGVDLGSNVLNYWAQKNEGKILPFLADWFTSSYSNLQMGHFSRHHLHSSLSYMPVPCKEPLKATKTR